MSNFEFQTHGVHFYPDERSRGGDMLWLEDPEAKIVYSSNHPGLPNLSGNMEDEEGAEDPRSPVHEALRAIHVYAPSRHEEARTIQADAISIEPGLALDGLNWLIPLIDKNDRTFKRDATRTKARLEPIYAAQQHAKAQHAEAKVAEQLKEAKRNREAGYKAEIDAAIVIVGEDVAEHLQEDYAAIAALSNELTVYETKEGRPAVKETPAFREKFSERVATYLEEPSLLVTDLELVWLIGSVTDINSSDLAPEDDPLFVYGRVMSELITELTGNRTYSLAELAPEVVLKWMDVVGSLPADATFEFNSPKIATESEAETLLTASEAETIIKQDLLKITSVLGHNIISSSLRKIARDHPRELVDVMYNIADIGFDPEHPLKLKFAQTVLEECLSDKDRLAATILDISLGATKHPVIQSNALDLKMTLDNLGTPARILSPLPGSKSPAAEIRVLGFGRNRKILQQLYPSAFVPTRVTAADLSRLQPQAESLYQNLVMNFWNFANTPAGRGSTLYGRFLEAADKEEITGGKPTKKRKRNK